MGNVIHSTYTTGIHALPDIYAQARGPHSSLWYKYNLATTLMIAANETKLNLERYVLIVVPSQSLRCADTHLTYQI